jgi:serine/threonine-protein kinase 24/25/MST4
MSKVSLAFLRFPKLIDIVSSNPAVKQHVQTSRGLFPHKRIIRKSEMTSKGLVVTEEQEEISGLPSTSSPTSSVAPTNGALPHETSSSRKSPIAELLYMRWLEGLKLKWPSMLSS